MANELVIGITISFSKGGATYRDGVTDSVTITGDTYTAGVQSVATSNTEIVQGASLGTPGFVFIQNLDATNYVEFGTTNDAVYTVKCKAGEFAVFRCTGATLYGKANTSACNVKYVIFED